MLKKDNVVAAIEGKYIETMNKMKQEFEAEMNKMRELRIKELKEL
jgi:hypothetical protein